MASVLKPIRKKIVFLALACGLAGLLLPAADVAGEIAQAAAEAKAQQWEKARDRNMRLLATQLDGLTADQAARCYKSLVNACEKLEPVDVDTILKGMDALLLKPDLQNNRALVDGSQAAIWAAWRAESRDEAAQLVDKILAYTQGEVIGRVGMYVVKIDHLRRNGMAVEAAALARRMVQADRSVGTANSWQCTQITDAMVAGAKEDGNWSQAATGWVDTMRLWDTSKVQYDGKTDGAVLALFRTMILPNITKPEDAEQVARMAAVCIPTVIRDPVRCHELQKAIVLAYLQTGQKDQAMAAMGTLYQTCPADRFDALVDDIAGMLKQMDGSIARANRFLDYVKFGTVGPDGKAGTEDDTANPFPEAKGDLSPEVAAAYQEAMAGNWKNTWEDMRAQSMLYRYMDEPQQALQLLGEAFSLAPMQPEPLQLVVGDMTNVLIQLSGDPADGDRLAQFLKFGKEGQDGKVGTDDDLADPRAPFLK